MPALMSTAHFPAAPVPKRGQQRADWRLPINPTAAALAIAERARLHDGLVLAVMRTPQGDHVMVVAADGQVSQRTVQLGNQQGGRWVVLSGLQAGEQVMVDGFQKLRGNAPVKPVPWQAPGTAAAPAQAPAEAATR